MALAQISAVPVKQTVTLSRLSWSALTEVGKLGHLDRKMAMPSSLANLQKWSDDGRGMISTADRCFAGISHAALNWQSRTHWWHLPSLFIATCQAVLMIFAVFPLFMGVGVPTLLFDCTTT